MEAHSGEFPVKSMATVLDVSRSGYYKYLSSKKQNKSRYDQDILDMLYRIWKTNRRAYGNIRLTKAMKIEYSPSIGRTKVISMMKLLKIKGKNKQKFKISSTDSNHNEPKVKDLVRRNFYQNDANRVWVSDVTVLETSKNNHVYLCIILDIFSRMIVGWSISIRNDTKLLIDATKNAINFRRPSAGLVLHSDRGSNYCSIEYRNYLYDNKILPSNSRSGNCWDNAVVESFFSTLKRELDYNKFYDISDAKNEVGNFIEIFYNRQRFHSFLNYKSPFEFEELYKN
jgi:putative transposase